MPHSKLHKKKISKNLIMLALIFGFVFIIWMITMIKMANAQDFDTPNSASTPLAPPAAMNDSNTDAKPAQEDAESIQEDTSKENSATETDAANTDKSKARNPDKDEDKDKDKKDIKYRAKLPQDDQDAERQAKQVFDIDESYIESREAHLQSQENVTERWWYEDLSKSKNAGADDTRADRPVKLKSERKMRNTFNANRHNGSASTVR